jgi:hypothetical protein
MAHAAIVECLVRARWTDAAPIVDPAIITRILAMDPLRHDRRRGEILLRSFVRSYLDDFRPPAPWRLEAAERRLPDGRTDLLFGHPDTGLVLVDEIKTARGREGVVEPEDGEQIERYLSQLAAEFGPRLLGVRLVQLGPPALAHCFRSVADLSLPPRQLLPMVL